RLGLEPIMWNITGFDWNAPSADSIESKVSRRLRGGNVILLHDGGHLDPKADRSRSVVATDRLIKRYKSEGFEFVTIPEMMKSSGRKTSAADRDSGLIVLAFVFAAAVRGGSRASLRCE